MAAIEITNISANAAAWAPGQTARITFTVKNVSGVLLTEMVLAFVLDVRDFTGDTGNSTTKLYLGYAAGSAPLVGDVVNLNNNTSRTFTVSFEIDDTIAGYFASYPDVRAVPLYLGYTAIQEGVGGTLDVPGYNVINGLYTPLIAEFSLERAEGGVPSDEGENVLSTVHLSTARADWASFLRATLYYARGGAADVSCASIDLTASIADMIAGVTDSASLIAETFSNGSDWDFLLVFGDDYETTAMHCTLGRAFANLHLSGVKSGGACFGGFSSSAEGDPKLESYYPAHFYGGIRGVTNFEAGEIPTGGVWIDGKPIYRYVLCTTASVSGGQEIIGTLPFAVDTLINSYGAMMSQDGSFRSLPHAYFGNSNWTAGYLATLSGDIYLQLGVSYSGTHRVVVVFEYTRADDAA